MLHSIKSSSFEAIPPGIYPVVFVSIKLIETKNGSCYRWEFKTVAGAEKNGEGRIISGLAGEPGKATVKNKYGKWLCAIAGRPLSVGDVDPEQYIGKRYQAVVNVDGNLDMFTPSGWTA